MRAKPYLFSLIVLLSLTLSANNSNLELDKDVWEKHTEGIDYTENYKELDKAEEEKSNNINPRSLSYDWSGLKYVFYFLVIGLVLFLIIKILSNLNKNPNIKKQDISIEAIEEIEEKIHEIDLEALLQDAINQKNYHIALRINFLIIIKALSERNSISWAKEKTNWEYYDEIKEALIKDAFKKIVLAFEPVWYGERVLTKDGFDRLQPTFDNFKSKLSPNE